MIPPESLEAIRSKLDIVELVAEYVPQMQRAGRNMKARCPFHQERTPSFIVSPERQTFHCFGCGEGGDAFAFLMKIENLSFSEAAEKLAGRTGVRLEPASEALSAEQRQRLKIKELLEFASGFYHELLLRSPQAQAARDYLARRHVSEKSVSAFRLGYAPRAATVVEPAVRKGFSRELLVKAGLAAERQGRGLRDYFYDRVLFPIRDARGETVGFGGRVLGDGEPKYLNSPDSPVFSKGRVLYGLFEGLATVRKARQVTLMEGYMDVIAAHQHGLTTSCAPLGTALTQDHATLIKRYAGEAVVVFDADRAGISAAIKGAEILLAAGLGARIAQVPEGKDPDEHLHKFGVEQFKASLAKASDLAQFKTELLLKAQTQPLSAEAKSAVAREILTTIARCGDEILKGEWIRRLAQKLNISEDSLRREMDKAAPSNWPRRPVAGSRRVGLTQADQQVLGLLFKMPRLSALTREDDFFSEIGGAIWKVLSGLEPWHGDWPAVLLENLPSAEKEAASQLLVLVGELDDDDPEAVLKSLLSRKRGMKRLKELEPGLNAAGGMVDPNLKEEYHKLLAELKGTRR